MTQEDKNLLLKDLCARLPYKVKGIITYDKSNTTFTVEGIDNNVLHLSDAEECYVEDFKPYLRSMSSMTEEECKYCAEHFGIQSVMLIGAQHGMIMPMEASPMFIDWLNEHHFDYRGLIEKGLALEAPEGMYNVKEK